MSRLLIDDDDPAVEYTPPWHPDPGAYQMMGRSRHGATETGTKATLTFTGTGVEVFGTVPPSSVDGYPTTTYTIDGQLLHSYTAPFVRDGDQLFNVSFFSTRNLEEKQHTLEITNVNGTAPNFFWLDYFLVDTDPQRPIPSSTFALSTSTLPSGTVRPPPPIPTTSTSPASTSLPVSSSSVASSSSTVSLPNQPTESSTNDSSSLASPSSAASSTFSSAVAPPSSFTSESRPNGISTEPSSSATVSVTGASAQRGPGPAPIAVIVGSVVGSLALIIVIVTLCVWRRRKRTIIEEAWREQEFASVDDLAESAKVSLSSDPYGNMHQSYSLNIGLSNSSPSGALPSSSRRSSLATSVRSHIASIPEISSSIGPTSSRSSAVTSSRAMGRAFADAKLKEYLYGAAGRTSTYTSSNRQGLTSVPRPLPSIPRSDSVIHIT
ncbi:hypothetical protein C8Q76DRAFT_315423 [Earliella scabrosa]|nr:hypothetical protein C8Q76DRAFT_315423 [Earliella scabrosa]